MADDKPKQSPDGEPSFSEQAEQETPGFFREFWDFICHNKKWWLVPILVVLAVMLLFVVLQASGVAVFMYPIF